VRDHILSRISGKQFWSVIIHAVAFNQLRFDYDTYVKDYTVKLIKTKTTTDTTLSK